MITLINRDRTLYDLEYRVADIVHEYQFTGKVDINTNAEGICLKRVKFYELLDYVCEKFKIEKKLINIYTVNALEEHDQYNIIIQPNHWILLTKQEIDTYYKIKNKQAELKTLSCFVGQVNWNRLILSSWLYNNFKDQCMLSFNYRNTDIDKLQSDLTMLNFYQSDALEEAVLFLKNTPIYVDELYHFKSTDINFKQHWHNVLNLTGFYDQIFIDLVVETYVMGHTFFPTEKTLRPIITKTPFIIMGPVNYLDNLKKLGFKTFGRWWDESYDFCEGVHRINEIKKIISYIMQWPQEKINQVLFEMSDVLEYNRNHYLTEKI